ncbi:hypothetical protein COCON_G00214720 [Conger conger]|uniref:Uncharacterized protein n=1 Tax=Conger conger TaxID=82655 RepID=A0A9Q1CXS7_CONCO|nr:hypothetical protein COCON_G00214720 [Conger conger]
MSRGLDDWLLKAHKGESGTITASGASPTQCPRRPFNSPDFGDRSVAIGNGPPLWRRLTSFLSHASSQISRGIAAESAHRPR